MLGKADFATVRSEIMGIDVSARVSSAGYELTLFPSSGLQTDLKKIGVFIDFLQIVQHLASTFHTLQQDVEKGPLEEVIIGADGPDDSGLEWTEAATEEEIASQSGGNSGAYLDDYDDDDDWDGDEWYDDDGNWGPEDYDEEEEPTEHATKEPFGDKCYCPFCNSECAPDYCYGCQSPLITPPIDLEIKGDDPDTPAPFSLDNLPF